jgi:hypothetical protein
MKIPALLVCFLAIIGGDVFGATKGYISDAACGWNNARESKEAKECAQKCVRAGWDPVFVPDGSMNTYKVRDKTKVASFVGEHVVVSGKLDGDTLTSSTLKIAPIVKRR